MSTMLAAVATVVERLGGEIADCDDIGCYAVELAVNNWQVFPLCGKAPLASCQQCRTEPRCPGPLSCGHQLCHGVLDATTDVGLVTAWWSGPHTGANIGLGVPPGLAVVDVDPRHGGHATLDALLRRYGPLPQTLTAWSGRGDDGRHLYFRRPFAPLSVKGLDGIDLKTSSGYVVAPPSLHPDTGQPYRWEGSEAAVMPLWLQHVLAPVQLAPKPSSRPRSTFSGDSVADRYSAEASWCDLLPRHGWRLVGGDGDSNGSSWRHPQATSAVSATIRHGCLFVYSPNTPFEVTADGDAHGYTKFRAYAVLNHAGNLSTAAKHLRAVAA